MHSQQGSQPSPAPGPGSVVVVEVADGGPVRIPAGVLADAMAAVPDARWVVCWPAGTAQEGVAEVLAAAGGVDDRTAMGAHRPVVDAIKRVVEGPDGQLVVGETVDRTTLRRVVAPLVVSAGTARRALAAAAADAELSPLAGLPDDGRVLPLP